MFTTEHVQFIIQKAALSFEKDDDGNERRVADLTLVIEPLPYALAAELGCVILDHLFTSEQQIRPELGKVTLNPRVGAQRVLVHGAPDAPALATIRNAKIGDFTVQPKEKHGQQWLKAQLTLTIDLAEKQIREFLFFHFGTIRLFSFFPEQSDFLEALRPRPGSGIDAVGVSVAGGPETTLHASGRTERKAH